MLKLNIFLVHLSLHVIITSIFFKCFLLNYALEFIKNLFVYKSAKREKELEEGFF